MGSPIPADSHHMFSIEMATLGYTPSLNSQRLLQTAAIRTNQGLVGPNFLVGTEADSWYPQDSNMATENCLKNTFK
jgi:hypothetical protein